MFQNIGADKIKYHKSKYSHKITLIRKIDQKFKKLGIHWGYSTKFSAQWDKIVIHLTIFSTLRQNCNLPLKLFGSVGQNCNSSIKLFETVGQNCYSPHKIFDNLRQNCNWLLKIFGTVGQNCNSPHNFFETATKLQLTSQIFQLCETKL